MYVYIRVTDMCTHTNTHTHTHTHTHKQRVTRVKYGDRTTVSVDTTFGDRTATKEYECDAVLCALGVDQIRKIAFTPELPGNVRKFLSACNTIKAELVSISYSPCILL
jgi:monoamine oxidase